jgi:hypothetical protein
MLPASHHHASRFTFKAANCGETAFQRLPQHFHFIKNAALAVPPTRTADRNRSPEPCSTLRADERRIKFLICHRCTSRVRNCFANGGVYEACSNQSFGRGDFCRRRPLAGESRNPRTSATFFVRVAGSGGAQTAENERPTSRRRSTGIQPGGTQLEGFQPGGTVSGQKRQSDSRLTICRGC